MTDWNSAVGIFFREASSWVSVSTVFFFSGFVGFLAIVRVDHLVKFGFNLGREVGLDLVDLRELGKSPSAVAAVVVDAGDPVGIHGGFLLFRIFATVAFDFNDEMQRVVIAVAVVHQHDEIGEILPHLGAEAIGDFEPQVVILHISFYAGMGFGNAAELGLPIAIEDDPVDVAAAGVRFPAGELRGVEFDMCGGTGGIVGIEDSLDGAGVHEAAGNGGGDAFTGHVGQFLIHELGGIRSTLA